MNTVFKMRPRYGSLPFSLMGASPLEQLRQPVLEQTMADLFRSFDANFRAPAWQVSEQGLHDRGDALVLLAHVPGLTEQDVEIVLEGRLLVVRGTRAVKAPEGWKALHRERGKVRLASRYELPCDVDADNARATLKDGRLEIVIPKAPESRPRTINVEAK
jgi:HSP20 family molecular chaperone IbpA